MHDDDNTLPTVEALLHQLADTGLTHEQAELVHALAGIVGELHYQIRVIHRAAGLPVSESASAAVRTALAMRMHGTSLRGPRGAEILENLAGLMLRCAAAEAKTREPVSMDDALFVTGARSKRQLAEWLGVPEFHCNGAARIPEYLVEPIREFIAKNVELTRVA